MLSLIMEINTMILNPTSHWNHKEYKREIETQLSNKDFRPSIKDIQDRLNLLKDSKNFFQKELPWIIVCWLLTFISLYFFGENFISGLLGLISMISIPYIIGAVFFGGRNKRWEIKRLEFELLSRKYSDKKN